jgi:succinyl-CoA synthetase beta subunit
MKLLEHESKTLLTLSNIPVPASSLITKTNQVLPTVPIVLKSQVPTGGRGKAGGIVIVETQDRLQPAIDTLFTLDIKGLTPKTLLAEEKLSIKKEFYLSILVDRQSAGITLIAHINGGIEVEENTNFKSWTVDDETNDTTPDVLGQYLADYYDLPSHTFALQDLVQNLLDCLVANDATMIEINPLVLTTGDKLVAGDCKITLDDAAGFRHDWKFEDTPAESNFVTIDPKGNIATIANGAGLAMATVDAAYEAGLTPANFLDIGGGANEQTLLKAFERIVEYPELQAIIINVFAGITRADEVAKAIVAAKKQIEGLPPLFIRIAGTNYQVAVEILIAEHIVIMPNLESCLTAAKEVINE